MWYGLLLVLLTGRAKRGMRKAGAVLKSYGRKLEHLGDDVTPRWSLKLFQQCYFAEVEIHLSSKVFHGYIDTIFQEFSGKESRLVIKLKERGDGEGEFKLTGYGAPVVIKEGGYDCVWTGCDGGYISIYSKRPLKNM